MTKATGQSGSDKTRNRRAGPPVVAGKDARSKDATKAEAGALGLNAKAPSVPILAETLRTRMQRALASDALTRAEILVVKRWVNVIRRLYDLPRKVSVSRQQGEQLLECIHWVCEGEVDRAWREFERASWPRETATEYVTLEECFRQASIRSESERTDIIRDHMREINRDLDRSFWERLARQPGTSEPYKPDDVEVWGHIAGFNFRSVEIENPVSVEPKTDNKKHRKGRKDEGSISDELAAYFEAKHLPRDLWEPTAAEIERVVRKQVNASQSRPLWNERARYPELAHLPAPEFLKRVWADAIASDGSIEKETIRQKDRALMATVEAYVANRQRRNLDAGLAKGLQFITRRSAPKGLELG